MLVSSLNSLNNLINIKKDVIFKNNYNRLKTIIFINLYICKIVKEKKIFIEV